jgi:hypothetical protein
MQGRQGKRKDSPRIYHAVFIELFFRQLDLGGSQD